MGRICDVYVTYIMYTGHTHHVTYMGTLTVMTRLLCVMDTHHVTYMGTLTVCVDSCVFTYDVLTSCDVYGHAVMTRSLCVH